MHRQRLFVASCVSLVTTSMINLGTDGAIPAGEL